jgi:penicillin-binding protein
VRFLATRKRTAKRKKMSPEQQTFFAINITLRVIRSVGLFIVSLLFIGGFLGMGIGLGYMAYLVHGTPTPTKTELEQKIGNISQTSKLVYAGNEEISTIQTDLQRTSVNSDQISDYLKQAIVATEDENFNVHKGVVPKAVLRALLSEVTGLGSGSGGSTLTQQLVKQQVLTNETSFKRKANEILLAMEVEHTLTKDEILTTYLNVSPFGRNNKGQNIAGVEEAAQGLFGKSAKDVTLPEAAYIAGLPQSPIVYSPYTNTGTLKEDNTYGLKRKDNVLFNMYRTKVITKQQYEEAKAYDITKDFIGQESAQQDAKDYLYYTVYDSAVDILMDQQAKKDGISAAEQKKNYDTYYQQAVNKLQNGGYTVHSTIDKGVYDAMQQGVADYGYTLDYDDNQVQTGNILMDNATGKVYGFVGGRDYATNQNNHAFDTTRQPGSSIKPVLVYGPAIDQGLIGSESMIADYPAKWKNGSDAGNDIVNASNKGTNTFESARLALEWSYNIPAYHVYQSLLDKNGSGNSIYDAYLSKMNYPASDNWGVESAPLGTINVSTLTQTNGFQTLANGGVYQEGYVVDSITDNTGATVYQHQLSPVRVYSAAAASIMNDMMRSVVTSGITTKYLSILQNQVNPTLGQLDWVGKTGSTDAFADHWLMLSTPQVTFSGWTGHEDNSAMDADSSLRNATYMAYLINRVYQVKPELFDTSQKFTLDKDVKKVSVSSFTGAVKSSFTYNGKTITDNGKAVDSLWVKSEVAKSSYEFGIGGTTANYTDYWKKNK